MIPAMKSIRMVRIVREATKIELFPDNMNSQEDFSQSRSWKPLVQTPKNAQVTYCLVTDIHLHWPLVDTLLFVRFSL